MDQELFLSFAIALGLGLLVGLQREYNKSEIAGIRTFPLITVLGTICSLLSQSFSPWIVVAGFLGVAGLVIVATILRARQSDPNPGQTTGVAALLMFALGAYLPVGDKVVAVALGGITAVLLQYKAPLHQLVHKMGSKELRIIMQFVLITLVVLPVLPDEDFGPYEVWNPRNIWLMVVFVVGIGISGYFAYKILGHKTGSLLGGVLGGLISSTATTVTYSRRSKQTPSLTRAIALVIMAASAVTFVRVIAGIAVVTPRNLGQMAPPLAGMLVLVSLLATGVYFWTGREDNAEMPEQENPAQLKIALIFGGLYALALLGIEAARDYFGSAGLYAVAIISGLTDLNAITLSTSRLVAGESLIPNTGWRLILVASLANLGFKAGIVALLGTWKLFYIIALLFGISIAGGMLVLWLWPKNFFF